MRNNIACFDFDGVLVDDEGYPHTGLDLLRWHEMLGHTCLVVTGRSGSRLSDCRDWLDRAGLDYVLVEGNSPGCDAAHHKGAVAAAIGHDVVAWYDDDPQALEAILPHCVDALVIHCAWPHMTLMAGFDVLDGVAVGMY